MGFEDEYAGKQKKKDPLRAFLPVIGLILALAFAAIAYSIMEPVHKLIADNVDGFPEPEMDTGVMEDKYPTYAVAGGIFVALVMVATVFFALFAPKPHKQVTENELKDEKRAIERENQERKRRKAKIRQQAMRERKESQKQDKK